MDLEDVILQTLPAVVIVTSTVKGARTALDRADFAFLDMNVTNGETFELAQILCEKGVSFAFISASSVERLPDALKTAKFIQKPAQPEKVRAALTTGLNHL